MLKISKIQGIKNQTPEPSKNRSILGLLDYSLISILKIFAHFSFDTGLIQQFEWLRNSNLLGFDN